MGKSIFSRLSRKDLESRAREKARDEALRATEEARRRSQPKLTKAEIAGLKKRDELIAQYMPYAASIAGRVCQTLSSAVDYEDVLCNARLGLLEAAKRYDEAENVDFRTFAYYRIKGAIYDGLRRSGWLPRTLYAKLKFEEAANEYLLHKSSSAVKSVDFNAEDEVAETVNTLASIYIVSLDASEDVDVADDQAIDVEQRSEVAEVRHYMREAIGTLPEKEKQLVKMYYFQNKTLEEVGDKLNLSKSWTSRLHARALSMLFKRIKQLASATKGDIKEDGEEEE